MLALVIDQKGTYNSPYMFSWCEVSPAGDFILLGLPLINSKIPRWSGLQSLFEDALSLLP